MSCVLSRLILLNCDMQELQIQSKFSEIHSAHEKKTYQQGTSFNIGLKTVH